MINTLDLRKEYLANQWNRYPEMPSHVNLAGRVEGVNELSLHLLNYDELNFTDDLKMGTYHPQQVLLPGDLVGLVYKQEKIQEIILLSPKLAEPSYEMRHRPERKVIEKFSQFLMQIKMHFSEKGFLECLTPTLVPGPGTEPFLDPFVTEFKMGKTQKKLYLPTSPELHLKKTLARGYGPVFEIKNCFRNGEISPHHEPEFLMLEWYRPFSNLEEIKIDLKDFLKEISGETQLKFVEKTMAELFQEVLGFTLTPKTTKNELLTLAQSLKLNSSESDSIDDIYNMLLIEKIEPAIGEKYSAYSPLILSRYPPFQAAYARIDEKGWADRFELYWKGVELANAFHEINDPVLQKVRMSSDLVKKNSTGRESVGLDEEFLHALEIATPPSGGIALGVERLFMVLTNAKSIQDFRIFPFK